MTDEDKRKYIEEIFKYCKIDSILVIGKTGQLERLKCPFEVLVIQNVGELEKGLICLVNVVKIDLSLIADSSLLKALKDIHGLQIGNK